MIILRASDRNTRPSRQGPPPIPPGVPRLLTTRRRTERSTAVTFQPRVPTSDPPKGPLMRRVVGRLFRAKLMLGWWTWLQWDLDQNRCHRLRLIVQRMSNVKLSRAFAKWCDLLRALVELRKKTLRRVANRLINAKLALGWWTWIRFLPELKKRDQLRVIVLRMRNAQLSRAFEKWRDYIRSWAIVVIVTVFETNFKRTTGGAFYAWKQHVGKSRKVLVQRSDLITEAKISRAPLRHCDCVYRVTAGLHCRCSSEKHLMNRLQKLRCEVQSVLDHQFDTSADSKFETGPFKATRTTTQSRKASAMALHSQSRW